MDKVNVTDFYGRVIATEEYRPNGDIIVTDFYGRVLGKYDAACDVTRDFYGSIIAQGDAHGMLIGR